MKTLDPRPIPKHTPLNLAVRLNPNELKQKTILLYDNTKLDVGHYRTVLTTLSDEFKMRGFNSIRILRETIRKKDAVDIKHMAKRIVESDVDAAVLCLGDMGVSTAMVLLTVELEQLGIPAVLITAGPGNELSRAVAYYRAKNLCLVATNLFPGSSKEDIETEIKNRFPELLAFLTNDKAELISKTSISNSYDHPKPDTSGYFPFQGKTLFAEPDAKEVYEHFTSSHIGDGLPVIPPTEELFEEMISWHSLPTTHSFITDIGPAGANITMKDLAINAVMAGCKPEYMPILVTAMEGICDPAYNLFQAITTSHSGGNLVLVSGPLAEEVGMNSGQGCLGPGNRANATIGRAINLTLKNTCRVITGFSDLACLSSPAEYTYCFAENREQSPWQGINEERFDSQTTTVSVLVAEAPRNVMDLASETGDSFLESLADCCSTLGSNNAYLPGNLVAILTPDHAQLLRKSGYTKNTLRQYVHERVHFPAGKLKKRGIAGLGIEKMADEEIMPVTRSPRDIEFVVAGGKGGHSAVILPWSLHSELIVKAVLLPNGFAPKSISDFSC